MNQEAIVIPPRLFFWLLAIIMIEGYVVLAYELLAIRQIVPFAGSGTDTVSIIIASVLMPLAFGYHAGGGFRARLTQPPIHRVREKLASNVRVAGLIALFGMSYLPMNFYFGGMYQSEITNRLAMTAIYAGMFLVVPVFLLGQTIPLISNFFSHRRLSRVTGTILFVSTIGSFLGAVFSTLVLMSFVGVNYTAFFCLILLAAILLIIGGKDRQKNLTHAIIFVVGGFLMNSNAVLESMDVVSYNQYNIVRVFDDEDGARHIALNGNFSSMIDKNGNPHEYIKFIEDRFITPTLDRPEVAPRDILVIGAGGFTIGMHDTKNNYDFLDIDPTLKDVAEDHFLPEKLAPNRKFLPVEARAYMATTQKKYDLIVVDAYLGHLALPEHLITRDFFKKTLDILKPGGAVAMNFIASANFSDAFSRNLDQTLRSVYPYVSRQIISEFNNIDFDKDLANLIYMYHNYQPGQERPTLYTDIRNTMFWDLPSSTRFKEKRKARPAPEATDIETPAPDAPAPETPAPETPAAPAE